MVRLRLALVTALLVLASAPALATFHLNKVKEVFPGTVASPNAQYVLLQAAAAGQNFVMGHAVHVYDASGTEIGTFTFSSNLSNSANQMTVLIATTEAASLFGVSADLTMTPDLPLAGGKVCWDVVDCVAWGGYSGGGMPSPVGTPFDVPVGLERGQAMQRRLNICGSPTILDLCDDTNDSANDFLFATPAPKNNAGTSGTIPPSTCGNGIIEGLEGCDDGNMASGDGCSSTCQPEPAAVTPQALDLDPSAGGSSNGNGVFEPGETVAVDPTWQNGGASSITLTGAASTFTGPSGATYTINDGSADYGTVGAGAMSTCATAADCYSLTVSNPFARPVQHWDATFTEVLSNTGFKAWTLHIGDSFPDVPTSNIFYAFIENIFHNGVTGGCGGTDYCPTNPALRKQMAVFVLKAKEGSSYVPPACAGIFMDVPCPGPFTDWIEELFNRGVVAGCGPGPIYCPDNSVLRQQMAVFLLKTLLGSGYVPPACTGIFADVPCPGPFTDWIEDLFHRGIAAGCGGGNFCPTNPNTRGQMAPFLVKTFGLLLYGP